MSIFCRILFTLLSTHLSRMQHRGELVQEAIRQNGFKVTEVARRLKVTRQTVHGYFHKRHLSLDIVMAIGKAIHHDFSDEIKELKGLRAIPDTTTEAGDLEPAYSRNLKGELYWKEKYYQLLESYTELLKEMKDARSKPGYPKP